MSDRPKRSASGQHPAVLAYRNKLDSIEKELPKLRALNRKIARAASRSTSSAPPAPRDPRREGDSEIPVDVVLLEDDDADQTS